MTTISSPSPTLKQLDQIATFFKQDKQKDALIKFESLPLYEQNRLYRTIWKEMGQPIIDGFGKTTFYDTKYTNEKIHAIKTLITKLTKEEKLNFLSKTRREIEDEYTQIHETSISLDQSKDFENASKIGREVKNCPLNLWIVPYDQTLVPMKDGTYINANFAFEKNYIQTQTPIPETRASFWQMVQEQAVQTIIMLNHLTEPKISPYWPERFNQPIFYGKVSVTLVDYTEHKAFPKNLGKEIPLIAQRKFLIEEKNEKPRSIVHLHYSWVDGGAPKENGLLKLIKKVKKAQGETKNPIVVHCSAGIGRTGVFTLVHESINNFESGKQINIPASLKEMRNPQTGRSPYMVANSKQYWFCYKILEAATKKKTPPSFSPKLTPKPFLDFASRLTEIKQLFEQENQEASIKLFSKIPEQIRNLVYKEMYGKMGEPKNVALDYGEVCFLDMKINGKKKALAIEEVFKRLF